MSTIPHDTNITPNSTASSTPPLTPTSAAHAASQPYGTRQEPASSAAKPKPNEAKLSDYPYILPGKVSFRDCDMYFHVNNATYYHYFDNLFNTFFVEEANMDPAYGSIIGITAANDCRYVADMSFPQRLRLALRVLSIGKTSSRIEAAVYKSTRTHIKTGGFHTGDGNLDVSLAHSESADEWVLAAVGTYVWVFCERVPGQKMKPVPIPDLMRQALQRAMSKTAVDAKK